MGREAAGEGVERIAGQEGAQGKGARREAGLVSHAAGIDPHHAAHGATALGGRETAGIARAIDIDLPAEPDAARDAHRAPHGGRQQGGHEVEPVSPGLHLQAGTQPVGAVEVLKEAVGPHAESRGQTESELAHAQPLQVAPHPAMHHQRLPGPVAGQVARQVVGGKEQQILPSYLAAERGLEGAGLHVGKGIEVHGEAEGHVGAGRGAHAQGGQREVRAESWRWL